MELGTIVQNLEGQIGVVAPDLMACCSSTEEPIVYNGTDSIAGTERDELKVLGMYDAHIEKPERCGLGLGAVACMYLSVESSERGVEFQCQRFSAMRNFLLFSQTNA
ncbi:MAG: hypothetical protein ACREGF_06730, partial [Candidatus Saccharimonadales bacterium]